MSELRKDIITRQWVIIANGRSQRPNSGTRLVPRESRPKGPDTPLCPFDAGNESHTPREITSFRSPGGQPDTAGWWVRVVPNKYPALTIEGEMTHSDAGIYDCHRGIGAHEVIIETPEHGKSLAEVGVGQVEEVLWMYRNRYLDLQQDKRLQHIMIFHNHGREAGASLAEHAHSQVIATPLIPKSIQDEVQGAALYAEYHGRCPYCAIIDDDLASGERLVAENASFVALEPYAARYPYETWIMPKRHDHAFVHLTKNEVVDWAAITRETLLRLYLGLGDPPFNSYIHAAPCGQQMIAFRPHYHWHMEIIPRLTVAAGFELGATNYINITPPEEAARVLREVVVPLEETKKVAEALASATR